MNVHLLNIFFKMTDKKSYQLKTNLIEKYIVDEYRMKKGEIDYIFNTFVSSSDNKSVSHWIMFDYFFHV